MLSPQLEVTWLQAMDAVYPGECSVLTAAERGMLKTFAAICSEACLASRADEVLDHTIKNWVSYRKNTESDHGAFNTPAKPTIGFLIKYPRPALNLWLSANGLKMRDGVPQPKPTPRLRPRQSMSTSRTTRLGSFTSATSGRPWPPSTGHRTWQTT